MLDSKSYSYIPHSYRHGWVWSVVDCVYPVFLVKSITLPSHLLDYEISLLNKLQVVHMSAQGIIRMHCAAAFSHLLKGKWLWINEAGSRFSSVTAVDVWLYIGSLGNEMYRVSEMLRKWTGIKNLCQNISDEEGDRSRKADGGMTSF